ncbi:serine/threonine protein kinase [Nocardiopsis sp. CC223A]|uniref:protein kinase domain-containing protein n=1 Tax=Nocardiopsis sp. CC223A TaxID=3044051 RepID=UPI00278BFC98|nr:serine/threonine protein kinase [Nocardiopsis sp. CC223A]
MKPGDVINGYRITTNATNAGGGKCMWAFAERDGQEYFVKRFLDPKRPKPSAGPPGKRHILSMQACEEFEERHRRIMDALKPEEDGGGNLVFARDFFCEGSTYYKVTERIDTSNLDSPHTLGAREKAILLKTLGQSLRLLHGIDIVHGDLKPDNVLIQRPTVFHTAKLIDFDDAYISGSPPPREEVAGDALYVSPEWLSYVKEDEGVGPEHLTTASDIFALGLLTHLYLTGALPSYTDAHDSPAAAVNAGETPVFDPRLTSGMRTLIGRMCLPDPVARPGAGVFVNALNPSLCELVLPSAGPKAPVGGEKNTVASAEAGRSRLRTNIGGAVDSEPAAADRNRAHGDRRSRVRINWS